MSCSIYGGIFRCPGLIHSPDFVFLRLNLAPLPRATVALGGFDHGTAPSTLWLATNESPHVLTFIEIDSSVKNINALLCLQKTNNNWSNLSVNREPKTS